jgi:hypothetical protein|tara:strand:+ start:493 stop:597 length:105 start_codon:yes stop_codon:yes gene_type:complete
VPNHYSNIRFEFGVVSGNGTVWLDDVRIEQVLAD